ncbi:hypothetical protein ACFE04_003918 [Oxalis oulophora]
MAGRGVIRQLLRSKFQSQSFTKTHEDAASAGIKSLRAFAILGVGVSGFLSFASIASASDEAKHGLESPNYPWPHEGILSSYDHASLSLGERRIILCSYASPDQLEAQVCIAAVKVPVIAPLPPLLPSLHKRGRGKTTKSVFRSLKAGLQFPVGRIARFLKKGLSTSPPSSNTSPPRFVLELAGNAPMDNKKIRIVPRHIQLGVRSCF